MLEVVTNINTAVNNVVWGWPALILLFAVGLLMTILTKGFQFTHFGHWMKNTIGAIFRDKHVVGHTKDKSISQFQSPGAVFWMWLIALLGMMTNYSENVLGIYYRRKNSFGEWSGGAMYYLRDGLGSYKNCKTIGKVLAVLFSVFCFLASFGIGNMTQVNSISGNMESVFRVPAWITGVVVLIVAGLVIVGGLKRIASVTEKIVPFMVVIYIIGSLFIFFTNLHQIPAVFAAIFKGAFGFKAASGGVVGYGIKLAIEMGMKRGVTLTAFSVLSSGLVDLDTGVAATEYAGVEITKANMISTVFFIRFGYIGGVFVAIAIMLFAFSTVLGWSHYGTKACEFLFGEKYTIIYRVIFVAAIFGGAVMGDNLAWDIADTLNGMMMIPNLIGVIALAPTVMRITSNYVARKLRGKDVEPMISNWEDIQAEQAAEVKLGAE